MVNYILTVRRLKNNQKRKILVLVDDVHCRSILGRELPNFWAFQPKVIVWENIRFFMVTPWLHLSPLTHLIAGSITACKALEAERIARTMSCKEQHSLGVRWGLMSNITPMEQENQEKDTNCTIFLARKVWRRRSFSIWVRFVRRRWHTARHWRKGRKVSNHLDVLVPVDDMEPRDKI